MLSAAPTDIVLITEDPMLEIAIRHLLGGEQGRLQLRAVAAFSALESSRVDWTGVPVVLADMSNRSDFAYASVLRDLAPQASVLYWCSPGIADEADRLRGVCDGVVSRSASGRDLLTALTNASGARVAQPSRQEARESEIHLTYRESQLMTLLARGYRNKAIAECLGITPGTVKVYLSTLFKKTGARDRFELTLFGVKNFLYGVAEKNGAVPVPVAARRAIARPVLTSIRLVSRDAAVAVR